MKDIQMFCNDPECPCDEACCQYCEKAATCQDRCENSKYKEKVYSSTEFLIESLCDLAEKMDCWLIEVAAEKIRGLTKGGEIECS